MSDNTPYDPAQYGGAPYYPQKPPKKKRTGVIIAVAGAAVFLLMCAAAGVGLIGWAVYQFADGLSYTESPAPRAPYLAAVYVEGVLDVYGDYYYGYTYNHGYLLDSLDNLINDENNKGVMLFINTPGGTVYATDELYLKIMEYKQTTGRPVYAYCDAIAASGGYYVASAADMIFINRNGMTGSIGVIMGTFFDLTGYFEEQGVKAVDIYMGENKNMGSEYEEMTEAQREIFRSIVQEDYDRFVAIVAESRGFDIETAAALADGRIYSPNQALACGLVDRVCFYDQAVDSLIEDFGFDEYIHVHDIRYYQPVSYYSFFKAAVEKNKMTEAELIIKMLELPVKGPAYYARVWR